MNKKSQTYPALNITKTMVFGIAAYIGVQMIADISSLQIVSFFGLALDGGTFIYPFSFTLRDLAHKVLGKRNTRTLIFSAAIINLFMAGFFYFVSFLPVDPANGGNPAWSAVLTPVWRITIASILAELVSELVDTEIYSLWVNRVTRNHQWSRVLASNAASVPLDSLLFAFLAFYGNLPIEAVWQIFIGNVIIKFAVTVLSIPLIYLGNDRAAID